MHRFGSEQDESDSSANSIHRSIPSLRKSLATLNIVVAAIALPTLGIEPSHAANLNSVLAEDCTPRPDADLVGCDYTDRDLISADFSGSNLTDAIFLRTKLDRANFTNSNLYGATWQGVRTYDAIFTNVKSGKIMGNHSRVPNINGDNWPSSFLINGYLVAEGANLEGANLSLGDFTYSYLKGINFSQADLTGADFTEAKIRDSSFENAHAKGAILNSARLTDVDMTNADFSSSGSVKTGSWPSFENVNLAGANLESSMFREVFLSNVSIQNTKFAGATMESVRSSTITGEVASQGKNFHFLKGTLIAPKSDIQNANLAGLDLRGLDFSKRYISKSTFSGSDLTGANFSESFMDSLDFSHTNLSKTNFTKSWIDNFLNNGDLATDFSDATLSGIKSSSVRASGSLNLPEGWTVWQRAFIGPGADVSGSSFGATELAGLDLSQVKLDNVNARGLTAAPSALPDGWIFKSNALIGPKANLANINLTNVDLSQADLTGITNGCNRGAPSDLPQGWLYARNCLYGPGVTIGIDDARSLDLSYADLRNAKFLETDFVGINLTGANLQGVYSTKLRAGNRSLTTCQFTCTLPENWSVIAGRLVGPGANLTGADLSKTNLQDVDLSHTTLDQVKSGGITGVPKALPDGWSLIAGYLLGPTADLSSANLTGLNLDGVDLSHAILQNDLSQVKSSNLSGNPSLPEGWSVKAGFLWGPSYLSLQNLNLTGVDVGQLDLSRLTQSGGLTGSPILPNGWALRKGYLLGPGVKIFSINFSNTDLSGLDLSRADLSGSIFENANLSETNLASATISRSNFRYANLTDANLTSTLSPEGQSVDFAYANLTRTEFTDSRLRRVNFYGAQLNSTDFSASTFVDASLNYAVLNQVSASDSFTGSGQVYCGTLTAPGAKLSNAEFVDCALNNFPSMEMTNVKFTRTRIVNASFQSSTLSSVEFLESQLTGVSFDDSKATSLSFRDSALTNIRFISATIKGLDLDGANLNTVNLANGKISGIVGDPQRLPAGILISNGYLVGPGIDLRDLDLTNWDLTNADLTGAMLSNSLLSQTKLDFVRSGAIYSLPKSLPQGWKISAGYLLGPTADLSNTVLNGVNLQGADLSQANLTGAVFQSVVGVPTAMPTNWKFKGGILFGPTANLSGLTIVNLDLSGLVLDHANLDNVQSSGLTGSNITLPPDWQIIRGSLVGPKSNLYNSKFSGVDLSNLDLSGVNFRYADLRNSELNGTILDGADLTGANLEGVRSSGIIGEPINMANSFRLINGCLVGPKFRSNNCDISGGDLSGLNLLGADFTGLKSGRLEGGPAFLPPGTAVASGYLVGPGANLEGATFEDIWIDGLNVEGTDFNGATFAGDTRLSVVGTAKNLPIGWKSVRLPREDKNFIFGPRAQLEDLDLFGAELDGVNLSHANLSGIKSGNISGTLDRLPDGWKLIQGYLVGPKASLLDASLPNTNFEGVSWEGTSLSNANISGSELIRARIRGSSIIGSNLQSLNLQSADIASSNFTASNLSNSNLAGATISTTVFESANLSSANLESSVWLDVNFTGVVLTGANIQGADFSGADLSGVVSGGLQGVPKALPKGFLIQNGTIVRTFEALGSMSIQGSGQLGTTINLNPIGWDSTTTFSYSWIVGGSAIEGESSALFIVRPKDLGKAVVARVTASKPGYASVIVQSNSLLAPYPILKITSAKVVGTPKVGKTLSVAVVIDKNYGTPSYQWLVDGKPVKSAIKNTLKLTSAQKGKKVSCSVSLKATGSKTIVKTTASIKVS